MARRRILEAIQLDKIAAVDRPCQEGAVVTLLKRASNEDRKSTSLSLADRITKDLIVLPMAMPQDDDEGAMDYNKALEEVCECEAWCNAKEELRPFVKALRDSLVSIYVDSNLDVPGRTLKIRDSVGQFLDTIQLKHAEAMPVIEQSVMGKRVRELRKNLLIAKAGMAMLQTMLVRKSGPAAEVHGDASEDYLDDTEPKQKHTQQVKVKKAWTDEARRKAAQARKLAGEHRRQEQSHRGNEAPIESAPNKHGLAASLHSHAARTYEEAEQHYNAGRMREGDETLARASDVYGSVANEFATRHKIMAKAAAERLQKKWTDEARKAAAEARKHRGIAADHQKAMDEVKAQHKDGLLTDKEATQAVSDHSDAAGLHEKAAKHYESAAKRFGRYGGKGWPTMLTSGGIGYLIRHYRASRSVSRGRRAGQDAMVASVRAGLPSGSASGIHFELGKAEGSRKAGEMRERRGDHLGPHRPPLRAKGPHTPRRSLRHVIGPRRGRQSLPRDIRELRTGPRHLPGGERKELLEHQRRQKLKHRARKEKTHPPPNAKKFVERRPLQKDVLGRVQALIAKSAIIFAQCEDVEDRVRKVLGNTAADYVHDFVHSSNKKFEGKSKEDRIRMALGAFYGRK